MWNFLFGYVILSIKGNGIERLLNALPTARISVWDVMRQRGGAVQLTMRMRDFRRLRRLFKVRYRCRCHIHILQKRGLPVWWHRLQKHPALLFGIPLAFAALIFLSSRVLHIGFTEPVAVETALLREALREEGITEWSSWMGADYAAAAERILARTDELAYISIGREGVFLKVDTRARIFAPDFLDQSIICDIIAREGGIVTSVHVLRGEARVKVGQTVQKGDVLISGWMSEAQYNTHAMGTVQVSRQYIGKVEALNFGQTLIETGKTALYGKISIAGVKIWERKPPFPWHTLSRLKDKSLSKFLLPIELLSGVYYESVPVDIPLTVEESVSQALARAEEKAFNMLPEDAAILLKDAYTKEENGTIFGYCVITTEEDIGETVARDIEQME